MPANLVPSRILFGSQIPEGVMAPVLVAHGEPDDHLRWTVLLADMLGASTGSVSMREAAETCMSPIKVSWQARLDALSYLLAHAPAPEGHGHRAVLVDVDALDTGPLPPEDLWDDRDFCRQRGEFLETLLGAIADGGWVVVRTNPSSATLGKLDFSAGAASVTEEATDEIGALLEQVSPESRPVLSWVVRSNTLELRDLKRLRDTGDAGSFERDILAVAYEAIPSHARKAGKQIAALRGPQPANGMLGPLPMFKTPSSSQMESPADGSPRPGAAVPPVEARAVQWLVECGFLQSAWDIDGHSSLRMPRAVRRYLLPLAKLWDPDLISCQHQTWGARPLDGSSLSEQLETHFHAVQGGVLDDAERSARYYATDLRALAFRLSRSEHHLEAAEVYRKIVHNFDPNDAYAWEYLAFNLALASGEDPLPEEDASYIRNAYEQAHELDKENPLYHGRWLGFRAQLGEDVSMDFNRFMARYVRKHGEDSRAISFFAEPALQGMIRGRWGKHLSQAINPWANVLLQHNQLRRFVRGGS